MRPFARTHKLLFAIFVISIILMIKNSTIPYPCDMPHLITFIFDRPTGACGAIADIVDVFTSSYVTSLIFYYAIEYIPSIRKAQRGKEIIDGELVNLELYIAEFLAMLRYAAMKNTNDKNFTSNALNNLPFQKNIDYPCKKRTIRNNDNSSTHMQPTSFNLVFQCNKYRDLILKNCQNLCSTPFFSFCDSGIIELISQIQLLGIFRMLPTPDVPIFKYKTRPTYFIGNDFFKLEEILTKLDTYALVTYRVEYESISDEEFEDYKREIQEYLSQHPQIAQYLRDINNPS